MHKLWPKKEWQAAIIVSLVVAQVVVVAGAEAGTGWRNEAVSMGPKLGEPSLKQTIIQLECNRKYMELTNFRLEVNSNFQI